MKKHVLSSLTVVIFFALLTLAFFAPILFTNTWYAPIGSDFVNFNYPNDLFAARSLQQGEVPLWNPYLAAGQPYAADPNIGFFYPLRLLLLLTSFSYQAMLYLAIFHYFLAGLFTYALARDLGASRWSSLIVGISFMFSGFLLGQMDHINIVISSTWMPLTFLLCRRALLQQKWTYALGAGLTLSLAILGGHQQFALFTGYWCGLWFIFYLVQRRGRGIVRSTALFGVMTAVGIVGAAVQIAPTLEFIQFTRRSVLSIEAAGLFSMVPLSWIHLIFPHYLGQTHTQGALFWPNPVFVNEFYVYVGVVVLFGALIGSYVWKSWEKRFLATMVILGFLLTAGTVTPIYRLAYRIVPGMQLVRVPGRFVFWVDIALVLLGAFGLDWLLSHLTDKNHKLWHDVIKLLGLGILAGLLTRFIYPLVPGWQVVEEHPFAAEITQYRLNDALMFAGLMLGMLLIVSLHRYRPGLRNWVPILWLGLVIFDMFRVQQPRHFTTYNVLRHYQHPEIIQLWRNDPGFYRVGYLEGATRGSLDEFGQEPGWSVMTGFIYGFLQPYGLPWNPFDLQTFYDYQQAIRLDSPFYDFLGVKYLVTSQEELSSKWVQRPVATSTLKVYENRQVLPRAFMVFSSVVEPDQAQALTLIQESLFDPATTVLLAEGEPIAGSVGNAQVMVTEMTNNTLIIRVESDEPGYLVVSDTYYPGWQALVNGEEREILQANYNFRAVWLEAGKSTVHFEYRATAVTWGAIITLITWVTAGVAVLLAKATGTLENTGHLSINPRTRG